MAVKAMPFEPSRLSGDDEVWKEFGRSVTRYCIVDADTGEILDDAQGYGYKTAQKAHAAWAYKTCDPAKMDAKIKRHDEVWDWLRANRSFMRDVDYMAFLVAKGSLGPDDVVDAACIQDMLDERGLQCPFSASELLKFWNDGEYPKYAKQRRNYKHGKRRKK